jgi:hypothetical protein
VEGPGMQSWNKEPGHKTAAMMQEGIQQDPHEDPRAGDRETSSWDFQQVVDNQGLGIVEGSQTEKKRKHLNTLEKYCVYKTSEDGLQMNDTYIDTHNPIFEVIQI